MLGLLSSAFMSRLHYCAHCNQEFVPQGDEADTRCPRCMRQTGVRAAGEVQVNKASKRPALLAALVLVVVAVGAYGWYRSSTALEETTPLKPLSTGKLRAYLERAKVDSGRYPELFSLDERKDLGGEPGAVARSIHERMARWPLDHHLPRDVWTANEVFQQLDQTEGRVKLYPLEAAVAMAAVLRESGSDAMVVDVWEFEGEGKPPDPSGVLGYFIVAVSESDPPNATGLYDPWGGRESVRSDATRMLSDTQVVAASLGTNARSMSMQALQAGEALPLIQDALLLDPRAPYLRSAHAKVLIEAGVVKDATEEFEVARQLRDDPPRKLDSAQLRLAQAREFEVNGDNEAALQQWHLANRLAVELVESSPRYAQAQMLLSQIHLTARDLGRARAALDEAERLEPDSVELPLAWAEYYYVNRQPEEAVIVLERAIERRPDDWQLRFQAARAYAGTGDLASSRVHARKALALLPSGRRAKLKTLAREMLGFDPESETDASSANLPDPDPTLRTPYGAPSPFGQAGAAPRDEDLKLEVPGEDLQLNLTD